MLRVDDVVMDGSFNFIEKAQLVKRVVKCAACPSHQIS